MAIGVLTGAGVAFSSTPFLAEENTAGFFDTSKKGLPPQMIEIYDYFQEIRKRDQQKTGPKKISIPKAEKLLKAIVSLLKETDKNSMICFIYENVASGIKGQEILVDLGVHCLSFVDFVDYNLKGHYFEILNLIFHRGELDLGQVGFIGKAKDNVSQNKSILESKKKLAVKYQYFIYEALRYCIDKLNRKAIDFYKRDFLVFNIAIAYFKVPEFRQAFLDSIMKEKLVDVPEWRETHNRLDGDSYEENKEESSIDHFFNWNDYFYNWIPESEQKKKNLSILANIMALNRWEEKLAKRGVALFLIVAKWAKYVQTTIVNNNVMWFNIPGYSSILKVIFHWMKQKPVVEYPDALVEATWALLGNEHIMYVFIDIIFKKTNLFVCKDVSRTMDIVDKWFDIIGNDGKKFPSNFDFNFFFKGIEMLLDYEHAITTPKWLWLLYRIFHIFPLQEQLVLSEKLFDKRFGSLFFSWSWNIRTVFYKLFLYQFINVYGGNEVPEDTTDNSDTAKFNKQKKKKSSKNLHVARFQAIKNISTTVNTKMLKSRQKRDEHVINKIMKIAHTRQAHINTLLKAFEDGELNETQLREEAEGDSYEDSASNSSVDAKMRNEDLQERTQDELLAIIQKDIPEKYRHYIGQAVQDFIKDKNDYLAWLAEEDDKHELPEIVLAVPLDETENPDNPIDDW